MGQQPQRVERLVDSEAGTLQDALQVRRDEEGGRRAETAQRVQSGVRVESAEDDKSEPPANNVLVEKRIDTVWYIGEQTMTCRSDGSKRQTAASSS